MRITMFLEAIKASAFAGLPIFLITYILISRAIRSKRLGDFSDESSLNDAFKIMAKSHKQDKADKNDVHKDHLLLNKWLFFGGGFYGLMALVTYAYIEIGEIVSFLANIFDLNWSEFFSAISINMLVDFFVNSIMNLVDAFVWFMYWPKVIAMNNGWVWLVVIYVAYLAGSRAAKFKPFTFRLRRYLWAKFSKSSDVNN